MSLRVAIFASGAGSNALHLLETSKKLTGIEIRLLIVDQVRSPLPAKVKEHYPELEVRVIPATGRGDLSSRRLEHETQILLALREQRIDWIFLAGYMRILGPTLISAYALKGASRIVNIHPSLLPRYPGLHAYERAFEAGDPESGITIHLVDEGVDTGPILVQQSFKRLPEDTLETFMQRGKSLEWTLYGEVLTRLAKNQSLSPIIKEDL